MIYSQTSGSTRDFWASPVSSSLPTQVPVASALDGLAAMDERARGAPAGAAEPGADLRAFFAAARGQLRRGRVCH